ncbi:MAG: CHAD domain-containing protein [Planctomycetota bacterium]|nr:CHAD domain-containing protein [Planctomycetota bacterium]
MTGASESSPSSGRESLTSALTMAPSARDAALALIDAFERAWAQMESAPDASARDASTREASAEHGPPSTKRGAIHRLRIAARRAETLARLVREAVPARTLRRASRLFRGVLRATGELRDTDAHLAWLGELHERSDAGGVRQAITALRRRRRELARRARRELDALARRRLRIARLREAIEALEPGDLAAAFGAGAYVVHARVREGLTHATTGAQLHRLRVWLKRMRAAHRLAAMPELDPRLIDLTRTLGGLNDLRTLCRRLDEEGSASASDLSHRLRAILSRRQEALLADLSEARRADLVSRVPSIAVREAHAHLGAPRTLAVIDIGSNAVRLLAVRLGEPGGRKTLADDRTTTRLGRDVAATGSLSREARDQTLEAVGVFVERARELGADRISVLATAAVRDAGDGEVFAAEVERATGLPVRIVSGLEEAHLALAGVAPAGEVRGPDDVLSRGPALVCDLGGGSLELVLTVPGRGGPVVVALESLPLGAVRLADTFGGPDEAAGPRLRELRRYVRREIDRVAREWPVRPRAVIATGGTATTIAAMAREALPGAAPLEVPAALVKDLLDACAAATRDERSLMPGLPPDRADIIVPGLCVMHRVLKSALRGRARGGVLHVRPGGIREGELRRLLAGDVQHGASDDLVARARELAWRARTDSAQASRASALARSMWDALGLDPADAALLESAASLAEVGTVLARSRAFHKRSRDLIRVADLGPITPRDREVLALSVRYHRRSEPSPAHRDFGALTLEDRRRVEALASVLRVACAVGRTARAEVRVGAVRAGAEGLTIELARVEPEGAGDGEVSPELAPIARARASMLETVLGKPVRFRDA